MERRSRGSSGADRPEEGKRYYRIGEVSKLTGVKPYVLRYWETEFRWMVPAKSRSKQRMYRPRDIETIRLIKKLLYEQRFTIAGARQRLREMGVGHPAEAPGLDIEAHPRAHLRRIKEELQALRAML